MNVRPSPTREIWGGAHNALTRPAAKRKTAIGSNLFATGQTTELTDLPDDAHRAEDLCDRFAAPLQRDSRITLWFELAARDSVSTDPEQ